MSPAPPQLHLLVVSLTLRLKLKLERQAARVRMIESRAERNALGAAPDISVVDVGLNFLSSKTQLLNRTRARK